MEASSLSSKAVALVHPLLSSFCLFVYLIALIDTCNNFSEIFVYDCTRAGTFFPPNFILKMVPDTQTISYKHFWNILVN